MLLQSWSTGGALGANAYEIERGQAAPGRESLRFGCRFNTVLPTHLVGELWAKTAH